MPWPTPELDAQASRELEGERRLHEQTVAGIHAHDASARVRECERHLDRVHEIMLAFTRRVGTAPAAG